MSFERIVDLFDFREEPFRPEEIHRRDLLWPVEIHCVSALRKGRPRNPNTEGENVFNDLVADLLDAYGTPLPSENVLKRRVAADACINEKLAALILARFKDKGWLDSEGRKSRKTGRERLAAEVKPTILYCLRELVGGKWLPFFRLEEEFRFKLFDDLNVLWETAFRLPHMEVAPEDEREETRLNQDVLERDILKKMHYGTKRELTPSMLSSVHDIGRPSRGWIHCPICLLGGSEEGEFRIADPLGNGTAPLLERQMLSQLSGNGEAAGKIQDWFNKWVEDVRGKPENVGTGIVAVFGRMERSFRDYCLFDLGLCDGPLLDSFAPELEKSEISKRLRESATEMGFFVRDDDRSFRPVPAGKIQDFKNGQAEWQTVLDLAFLRGSNLKDGKLKKLACGIPDFLQKAWRFKNLRDGVAHGESKYRTREDWSVFVKQIESILGHHFRNGNEVTADPYAAQLNVLHWFGVPACFRMHDVVKWNLYWAEAFCVGFPERGDLMPFLNAIYAALQRLVQDVNGKMRTNERMVPGSRERILEELDNKAKNAGFDAFPDSVRSVSEKRLISTLTGQSAGTLGTQVLAFLWKTAPDRLSEWRETEPEFLSLVDRLLTARRHGNQEYLGDTALLRTQFRKPFYRLIKHLMETFGDETHS